MRQRICANAKRLAPRAIVESGRGGCNVDRPLLVNCDRSSTLSGVVSVGAFGGRNGHSLPAAKEIIKTKLNRRKTAKIAGFPVPPHAGFRRAASCFSQASVCATMVSRFWNCGRQGSIARMRFTFATSAGTSPGRRCETSTGKSRPLARRTESTTSNTEAPCP